jgi:predicted DNA-binding transcriptional regulator AlpA
MTELWSVECIAKFCKFGRSKTYELVYTPGFPKAIRVNGSRPRWDADKVRAYFEAWEETA